MLSEAARIVREAVHEVLLHDERIGSIRSRDDFTKFVFDRDYWDRPGRAVLGGWFEGHMENDYL